MKDLNLTEEEQKQIEASRRINEMRAKASTALEAWAKEHNAQLAIDPNSPIGNPEITIQILNP